jgi:hypothetical protein
MVAALSCSYEANQGGSLSPEVVTAHEAFFSGGIIEANQGGSLKPTRKGQINLLVLTRQTREAASNQLKRPTLLGLGGKPGWQPQASQKGQTLGVEANQGGSLKPLKLRPGLGTEANQGGSLGPTSDSQATAFSAETNQGGSLNEPRKVEINLGFWEWQEA